MTAGESEVRQYLQSSRLLPLLQLGIEQFLREQNLGSSARDLKGPPPLEWLASWLMRHHPEHDEAMGQRLGSSGYAVSESDMDEDERLRALVVDECMRKVADGLMLTEADMKVLQVERAFQNVKEGHMLDEVSRGRPTRCARVHAR